MKSIWLFLVALALAVACETSTTREPFGLVGLGACAAGTSGEAGATGGAGMGGVAGEAGATGGVAGATGGADAGPPDWTADPQILAWYRADDGYVDKCASSAGCPWGALTEIGGAVTTAPLAIDGHAAYEPRKASGGFLQSTHTTSAPTFYPPVHAFVVARGYAGTPHDAWIAGGSGVGLRLGSGTNHVEILGTLASQVVTTPTAWHLYEIYFHTSATKVSIDGGAWTNAPTGNLSQWIGVVIGGTGVASYRADVDIAEALIYEGQMADPTRSSVWSYARTRYPSLALPAAPQTLPSTAATVAAGITLPADFDFIVIGGQSQNSNYTSAGSLTFTSGILELGNDNVYKAAVSKYDDPTNQTDLISLENPAALKSYGNAIAMANQIAAASGRPLVIVPCMLGGSGIVPPQSGGVLWAIWDPAFPRGFGLRNSLMGSMVARTQDAIARGGKFRYLWWDQGQAEAISDLAHVNAWVSKTDSALSYFYARTGLPERTIFAQMAVTPHGSNWAAARAAQPGLASASRIMVSEPDGPYEPDGLHDGPAAADALGGLVAGAALSAGW